MNKWRFMIDLNPDQDSFEFAIGMNWIWIAIILAVLKYLGNEFGG